MLQNRISTQLIYSFEANVWQHNAGWVFVSLPLEISSEIREHLKWQEEGWGRLKCSARIKDTEWSTAIWFDTKLQTYLLPLKAVIRKKLNIQLNGRQEVSVVL